MGIWWVGVAPSGTGRSPRLGSEQWASPLLLRHCRSTNQRGPFQMRVTNRRGLLGVFLAVVMMVGILPTVASAAPSSSGCQNRNLNQIDKLLECVDAEDVFVHLQALQDIADANGGTRASGTPGYDAVGRLRRRPARGRRLHRRAPGVRLQSLHRELELADRRCGRHRRRRRCSSRAPASITGGNVIPVDLDLGLGNALDVGL